MKIKRIIQTIQEQVGRTLMEMLAVLTIAGVISLVGLLALQYAMEMSRENETLNRYAKVVAGARTSRILQNQGDYTKYDLNTGGLLPEFQPQVVNMNDVISNIGDDIIVQKDRSYILAPLKGPVKDGTEKQVEIYAYVETPEAFTVYADNLTYNACMKILLKDLGNDFAFEAQDELQEWLAGTSTKQKGVAADLCKKVVGDSNQRGTLVLWFGPYECMAEGCTPPACKGAECCCETIGCAEPNADDVCVRKDGYASCEPSCDAGPCLNKKMPYYCGGDLCCANAKDCGDGKCKSGGGGDGPYLPPEPDIPPIVPPFDGCPAPKFWCGVDCCEANQTCKNGKCEDLEQCPPDKPVPCPQAPNCCPKNQMCNNGKCQNTDDDCIAECQGDGGSGIRMDTGECCCSGDNGRIVEI